MRKFLLSVFIFTAAICAAEGISDNFVCEGFTVLRGGEKKLTINSNYIDVTLWKDDTPDSQYNISVKAQNFLELQLFPDSSVSDSEARIANLYSVLYSLNHNEDVLSEGVVALPLFKGEKVLLKGQLLYDGGKSLTEAPLDIIAYWLFIDGKHASTLKFEINLGEYNVFYDIPLPNLINSFRDLYISGAKKGRYYYVDFDGTIYQDDKVLYEKKWNPETDSFGN